ncbi:MAG: nicotinate-nucleotide--dimethylbenzimidazole phosphoribosyltransferase [Ruminococcaceae bacterium]|nr:nicotinate-nucleotide--dimethylbenzimidazole phosphoribosyltransferase [Oscillospiraceae bacterium]
MTLEEIIGGITPPDEDARNRARERWNACAKPLGSLGLLETAVEDIAALTGSADVDLSVRAALVLCADNGVVRRGVTQTDSGVTAAVARQLALGRTSVCRMARVAKCRVVPVDVGILDFAGCDGVLDRRIGNGTADFTEGPAMSRAQAERAILTGVELVREEAARGTRLIATGEMGIGNTTTSSAVTAVLLSRPPETVTGRGAGLSDAALNRKIEVVRQGIAANSPDAGDPVDVLSKVGGFDLAGLCGVFLGGALYRVPVLIDGFPSAAAALCAARLCPDARKAMLASHVSAEPAGELLLRELGKRALIHADMRLGEGTGAVAAMPLLDMALAVYREAYTFAEGGIEPYVPQEGAP